MRMIWKVIMEIGHTPSFRKNSNTNQVLTLILPLNLAQRCEQGNYLCKSDPSISVLVSKKENNVFICELASLLLTSSRGRPLYLKQRLNLYKISGFGQMTQKTNLKS